MPSPLRDSGEISRRIQRQMPAAATGGAVIGLYLMSLASLFIANVLRYAFSFPTRMYMVGGRFWGILALLAFAQGAFLIGGPVLVHPALMFLLIGMAFVLTSQATTLESLYAKCGNKFYRHQDVYLDGLTGEIAMMTILLWGGVALAIWWSPDTSAIFKWIGLGEWKLRIREFWYFWFVIVLFQMLLGNSAVKFLIGSRIERHARSERDSFATGDGRYTDEQKRLNEKSISDQHELMKRELRSAQSENATWTVLPATALCTGLYWLVIWYFHGYQLKWTVV